MVRNRKKFNFGEVIEDQFADPESENEHEYIADDDFSDPEPGFVPGSDSDSDYEVEDTVPMAVLVTLPLWICLD